MASTAEGTTDPASVAGPGIGTRLRAGRERAGLTLLQAAERLHMEPRMLEALESEAFGLLGAPVYVRGHLKHYAELIGESAAELQQAYASSLVAASVPDITRFPQVEKPPTDTRKLLAPLAIALVIAAFAGVVWWVLSASRRTPVQAVVPAEGAAQPAATAARVAPAPAVTPAAAPPSAPAVSEGATPGSAARAAPARPAAKPTAPVLAIGAPPRPGATTTPAPVGARPPAGALAAPETELRLTFSADSWAEVYDAEGNRLYYDVASANTEQTLRGKPPLRVVLGHAPGVSVAVNGRSAAIPPRALRDEGAEFLVNRGGRLAVSP